MRERLQKFDYRRSPYVRPTQPWLCGWTAAGRPCRIGPDAKGRCQATAECEPSRGKGRRWTCTRSELAGGACEEGPRPDGSCARPIPRCQPVRSLRTKRGTLARWSLAATFGLLLLFLGGSAGPAVISPGAVTFQHSEVASCAGCHGAFDEPGSAWLLAAFAMRSARADSERCVRCHALGADAFRPHGLASSVLAGLSERAAPPLPGASAPLVVAAARIALPANTGPDGTLECATCHQEHRGPDADLTTLANQRCMTCHKSQFQSFSEGHPEFDGYPYARRTRIAFDHASHIGKHFREDRLKDKAPGQCKDCHQPDRGGGMMLVRGFGPACAACHAGQIEGEGRMTAQGIGVFGVPGLDAEALERAGVAIGGWPLEADGEITPFMDFLLMPDTRYAKARATLGGRDLYDLANADAATLKAVEDVAWSIKGLYFDLVTTGAAALGKRYAAALGRPLATGEVARLSGLVSPDTLRAAQVAWFPNLLGEVPSHRAGKRVATPLAVKEVAQKIAVAPQAEEGAGDKDTSDILGEEKESADILGEDEQSDILGEDKESGILTDDDAGKPAATKDAAPAAPMEAEVAAGEDWVAAGGWYRDYFTLHYRPTAHDDPFLKAWLDATASLTGVANAVFEALADPKAPGVCLKCHSVDARAAGGLAVNWRGDHPMPDEQAFTAFSHVAHFSLLDQRGCLSCHAVAAASPYQAAFQGRDITRFASNFGPINRGLCAECHVGRAAGDSCLTCHNYHVGMLPPAVAATPAMMDAMKK